MFIVHQNLEVFLMMNELVVCRCARPGFHFDVSVCVLMQAVLGRCEAVQDRVNACFLVFHQRVRSSGVPDYDDHCT